MLLPVSFIDNLRPEASITQRALSNSHIPQYSGPSFMLLVLLELYWIFFFNWISIIDFPSSSLTVQFSSFQSLSHVRLFVIPWTAACQASLSITNSRSLLKLMSIELVIHPPSHPLLYPSSPAFNPSQHQGLFQWVSSSHQVAKVLEFQLQHQSFQWIFRTDFL